MKRITLLMFFFCLFSAFSAGGDCFAAASASELQSEPLAGEIPSLTASIQNLARLLEEQSRVEEKERKLEMAIAYLSFRSRRIEAVERDLNDARRKKERREDLLRDWRLREELLENEIRNDPQGGTKELVHSMKEAGLRRKALEQRMMRGESEVVVLENRIAELQNQIDAVERFVQRNLEL